MPRIAGHEGHRRAIARRLRRERERASMTPAQAAKTLGCSRQNYAKMEGGDYRIPAEVLPVLALAFGSSVMLFFSDRVDGTREEPNAMRLHG